MLHAAPEAAPAMRSVWSLLDMFESLRTLDDIPQAIVLHGLPGGEVRSAEVAVLRPDGTIEEVASFGIRAGSGCPRQPESVWSGSPRSRAARTGAPVVMTFDDGSPGVHVCVPITSGTATYGVLSCYVDTPDEETAKEAAITLALFAGLLSSAMALSTTFAHMLGTGFDRRAGRAPSVPERPELTQRQQEVLQLMSEGCTNAQMAARLRFSESTIRMETIAIYRALGVHARKKAIEVARELGLLEAPAAERIHLA